MSDLEINSLDWQKMNGLLPAIIQDAENGRVLMLGYMNQEALIASVTSGQLTLYSRSRQRLWRKGETSGNTMAIQYISANCDNDSLLVQVIPKGAACHLGTISYYQPAFNSTLGFLDDKIKFINAQIESEAENKDKLNYAHSLGEQAIKTIIAAVSPAEVNLLQELALLITHTLALCIVCELNFYDVLQYLHETKSTLTD